MLIKNSYGFYFEKNLVSQDQSGKGKQKLKYNAVCQTLSFKPSRSSKCKSAPVVVQLVMSDSAKYSPLVVQKMFHFSQLNLLKDMLSILFFIKTIYKD